MLNLMVKISEKLEQIGGIEEFIKKYGKAEVQFFKRKPEPHQIDFSQMIEYLCLNYNMKEITIHPPLNNYDIEVVLMYDINIIKEQLQQLVYYSNKFNINLNLIYHTHWSMVLHRANTISKIKELLKIIEGTNVKLLIENLFMMEEPFNECTALQLCKEINNDNLKMCLDICHFYCQANMYRENINDWLSNKLNRSDCEKYVYQIHFSYTANNDGYKNKKETHGVGHPTKELCIEDFKLLKKYGIDQKQIVTEIAEKDYSYRESQIKDLIWLENI